MARVKNTARDDSKDATANPTAGSSRVDTPSENVASVEATNLGGSKGPAQKDAKTSASKGDDAADVEDAADAGEADSEEGDKVLPHTTELGGQLLLHLT